MYGKSPVELPAAHRLPDAPSTSRSATRSARATAWSACPAPRGGPRRRASKPQRRRLHDLPRRPDPGARAGPVLAFSDLQADISAELIRRRAAGLLHQPALDGRDPRDHPHGGRRCSGLEPAAARARRRTCATRSRQVREFSQRVARPAARLLRGVARPADRGHPLGVGADRDRRRPRRLRRAARRGRSARERVVDPAEVVRRDPQIILASWCGKPVDLDAIRGAPGLGARSARCASGRIHEVDGADILSPGPVAAGRAPAHPRDRPAGPRRARLISTRCSVPRAAKTWTHLR